MLTALYSVKAGLLIFLSFTFSAYLSESRKGQTSGTGGVEGRSFASAMMCSKVMSV